MNREDLRRVRAIQDLLDEREEWGMRIEILEDTDYITVGDMQEGFCINDLYFGESFDSIKECIKACIDAEIAKINEHLKELQFEDD